MSLPTLVHQVLTWPALTPARVAAFIGVVVLLAANAGLVHMMAHWAMTPTTRGDFLAWEWATATDNPFSNPGWRYSPVAAWLLEPIVWMGLDAWRAAHFALLLLLAPEWILIAAIAVSFPFWHDVASGSLLILVLVPGILALRGNRAAVIVSYALMLLMPRPLVVPLGIWLLWKQPWSRPWFAALFVIHGLIVLMTGLADDWAIRLFATAGPEMQHEFNYAPTRWIGVAWLPIGLVLAVWLTVRGHVGLAGLAASPYLFPYYFIIAFLDVPRATVRLRPGRLSPASMGAVLSVVAVLVTVSCAAQTSVTVVPTASATAEPTATIQETVGPSPSPSAKPTPSLGVRLQPIAIGFEEPTAMIEVDGRLLVAERGGTVRAVTDGAPILNLSDRLTTDFYEQGLVGLASDGERLYVHYTATDNANIIESYPLDGRGEAEHVLRVEQPAPMHNGGQIAFGPDGALYVGIGDGGPDYDPDGQAQNPETLLGSIVRIAGGEAEVWAYGLRNPWRFSFDRDSGDLWLGDVGQHNIEEINRVPSSASGVNFGWPILEGDVCFAQPEHPVPACDTAGLTMPVATYDHQGGRCAVVGGYVYRGAAQPDLVGDYVFGDYCSGEVWILEPESGVMHRGPVLDSMISSFAEDADGELYVLGYDGTIYRLVAD